MTELPSEHLPASSDPATDAPVGWTRRRLLLAGALGIGAAWAVAQRSPAVASGSVTRLEGPVDDPGSALQPAVRVTTPPLVDPPAPGEVLFPIVVGPDDSCYVLDNYGDCRGSGCSRLHEGVDIMADRGLPVMATAAGELTNKYEDRGLSYGAGHGWTLDGDDGVVYKFFHLDRHEEGLEVGSRVELGQVIGYVGNTGTSGVLYDPPANYHLHFEYRPNNVPADSFHLLQRPEHVVFAR